MSSNPIPIGEAWRQAFDFPAGFFQPGDIVRCDFRQFAYQRTPLATITKGRGTFIDGDRLFLILTGEQTSNFPEGAVRTMPLLTRAGQNVFLDILIQIPVVLPYTRDRP